MPQYKAIFFDLGSTLLEYENADWEELDLRCMKAGYEVLLRLGCSVPEQTSFSEAFLQRFREKWKTSEELLVEIDICQFIDQVMADFGIQLVDGQREQFLLEYYQPITRQIKPFADTQSTLQQLQSEGYRFGLVSNSVFPVQFHRQELAHYGLLDYFTFTIFSSDLGVRKPHPEIFKQALKALSVGSAEQIEPPQVIFVGDRMREDIWGPQQIGLRTVLKWRKGRDYSLPVVPDAIICNLSELGPLLKMWNQTG